MPIFWSKLGERPDFLSYVCVCVCCWVTCLFYSSLYLPRKSRPALHMAQPGRGSPQPGSFTEAGNSTWHRENPRHYQLQKEILPKDKQSKVTHCQHIKLKAFPGWMNKGFKLLHWLKCSHVRFQWELKDIQTLGFKAAKNQKD